MSSTKPTAASNTSGSEETVFRLAAALIGAVLGASALLSAAAAATSALAGHRPAWTPLADGPSVLARLVRDPAHPGGAYPEQVAAAVTGHPLTYWLVLGLLTTATIALVAVGAAAWWRRRELEPSRARWATAAVERRVSVPNDPAARPYRLVAGRGTRTRRLVAADDCISAIAIGPNGSGKSTGLIIPNVLEWAGPVVMTTTKLQDLPDVITARSALGPVHVFAPAGLPASTGGVDGMGVPVPLVAWSPVGYATTADAADRMAEWLCEASGLAADTRARAWVLQARKLIKPLLLAAHSTGGGTSELVRWIYEGRAATEEVTATLTPDTTDTAGTVTAQRGARLTAGEWAAARREYASTWSIHDEGIGSVLFTAYGLADAYARALPHEDAAARRFDVTTFLDHRAAVASPVRGAPVSTLLIVAPESDGDRFAPVITALLAAVIHDAEHRAAHTGRPLHPRLLLALDEAANVLRFPRLPALLTTARGNGIQLLLAYHDLGQLEHAAGTKQAARTIISNAKLRILLPGVGDLETLQYFSHLLGRTRTRQQSTTRGHDGHRSTSTSQTSDDLAPLHALRELPEGTAVVAYQNQPPIKVRLRRSYTDRDLRALTTRAPASAPAEPTAPAPAPAKASTDDR
jgi:type IV secretion system protein VirD4